MEQRLAAVAVSVWDRTQKHVECVRKRHWPTREQILSKRQLDRSLSLPPSPKNESAPVVQQEPASSSSGPAAPMPTQNLQNEQMESPMELGAQERLERKGARPSETPTSEISGRPVVKARPASPPIIVLTAEGSGTVAVYLSTSSLRCPQSRYIVTDCLKFSRLVQRRYCEEALTPFQHFPVNLSVNKSFTKNAANCSKLTTNWQS